MSETPILNAPVYEHGYVTGRYLTAVADGPDADHLMDFTPAKGKVIFTPETVIRRHEGPSPALVVQRPVECALDDQGYLTSPGGGHGVALIAGIYSVRFGVQGAQVPGPKRIQVKASHTQDAPLDLVLSMPDVVPPGSVVVVDETTAQRANRSAREASAAADRAEDAATRADDAVKQANKAAALSQESAQSILPMLTGSVTITPKDGALHVDLGQAVNVATGVAGTSGAVDVIFPPVTTPDGRVDPDGLGTLLHVDAGAERLTWPGGTVVHGTPPEGESSLASLVRVGGAVTVVWPPTVATSTAPGVTAQVAEIEQIIGGEVEVQPGGTVMWDVPPDWDMAPAVFVNPYSRPTRSALALTVGEVTQSLFSGYNIIARNTHRPGGLTDRHIQASATFDPPGEPLQSQDGWLIATAPADADDTTMEKLLEISRRVPTSTVEVFRDRTRGVVLQYNAEDPHWEVSNEGGWVYLTYIKNGDTTMRRQGAFMASDLSLPLRVEGSDYESLGITLPGTFHRAAELRDMGVRGR